MDRQEAIEFLMDHYENPRNRGPLEHADVSLTGGNPGCADIITMQARFDKDGKIEEVHWDGEGCTISSAAASYVTEITQGMTAEEIEQLSFEDLIEQLLKWVVLVTRYPVERFDNKTLRATPRGHVLVPVRAARLPQRHPLTHERQDLL